MTPRIADIANRLVSSEELRRALCDPLTAEELEDILALRRWFTSRYTRADERLAYVRQAYARWTTRH